MPFLPGSRSRWLPLFALLVVTNLPRQGPPPPRTDSPVLELAIDRAKDDLAALRTATAALAQELAKRPGHTSTQRAALVDQDTTLVRATVWQTVADAEAAALASDGSAASQAIAAAADGPSRSIAHFRQLRAHRYRDGDGGHLEVVVFRTRPGTTREQNLERFDAAEAEFAAAAGLHEHSLWLAPDGRWVHLLRWGTAADYAATGKALFRQPGVGSWIRSLDFQRFVVTRGDVLGLPR